MKTAARTAWRTSTAVSLGRTAPALLAACSILAWLALAGAVLAADVPYLTGRIVDNAEILQPQTRARIEALLQAHERATTDQIAILTTPTLGGETIEPYAQDVFAAWRLGQKGRDNGILVIVAPAERRMRIEVGYGLEGAMSDIVAGRIVRNIMTPAFKAGDYSGGVEKGVEAIVAQLEGRGEELGLTSNLSDARQAIAELDAASNRLPWLARIFVACMFLAVVGSFTVLGVTMPGFGWFLYLFLVPFWAAFPSVILGPRPAMVLLGLYLVGFPVAKLIARRQPWYEQAARELKTRGRTSIGGVMIGSGGSSGSSGGGFSGGGGSSGGGGASGSW